MTADQLARIEFAFRKRADWINEEEVRLLRPAFSPSVSPINRNC